jgi:hypothetical protein
VTVPRLGCLGEVVGDISNFSSKPRGGNEVEGRRELGFYLITISFGSEEMPIHVRAMRIKLLVWMKRTGFRMGCKHTRTSGMQQQCTRFAAARSRFLFW